MDKPPGPVLSGQNCCVVKIAIIGVFLVQLSFSTFLVLLLLLYMWIVSCFDPSSTVVSFQHDHEFSLFDMLNTAFPFEISFFIRSYWFFQCLKRSTVLRVLLIVYEILLFCVVVDSLYNVL